MGEANTFATKQAMTTSLDYIRYPLNLKKLIQESLLTTLRQQSMSMFPASPQIPLYRLNQQLQSHKAAVSDGLKLSNNATSIHCVPSPFPLILVIFSPTDPVLTWSKILVSLLCPYLHPVCHYRRALHYKWRNYRAVPRMTPLFTKERNVAGGPYDTSKYYGKCKGMLHYQALHAIPLPCATC